MRLSAIGDTCHALSVVRRIQDAWPQSKLTWIIGKTEASLLADIPDVEFIIFDKSKGREAYKAVRMALAGRSFDVVLCMHASLRINLLYRSIRSPVRLGFDRQRARDFQWLFTNRRIEARSGQHALEAMMSFADTIGVPPQAIRWSIPLDHDARAFATRFLDPDKPLVLISPCSSNRSRNFRNWPVGHYQEVVRHLLKTGCRIVISGGTSELEKSYGDALSRDARVDNLVGTTSLKQLAALIDAANLVICPDSGPAHIATAFATPVLGLYATTNPARSGPYLSRELTVNRYPDAAVKYLGKPAEKLRWGRRVRHPDAMQLITVDDVTSRIDAFFDANAAAETQS